MPEIDAGNTAWVIVATALVFFMTPGLALFYGGMVRAKTVLNMMMMSFGAIGIVSVLWMLYGYSMVFGNDVGGGLLGNPTEFFALNGLVDDVSGGLPTLIFVAFQCTFAVITTALISGALADRVKFGAWLLFCGVWATIVYFPVAHWVFAFDGEDTVGGWIANRLGAIDFAGGTAVHINAGAAALAAVIVLGPRIGFGKTPFRPHNLPMVMTGAAILWFGWFGFNAGSALAADGLAALAFVNTIAATAVAMLAWLLVERIRDGHSTSLGAASGIVAGLVAITPSCASVNVIGAMIIGLVAGVLCALAVGLKYKFKYDDSLDVVGVHMVGGIVGTVLIGFLATSEVIEDTNGLFYGGGWELLGIQITAAVATIVFSFVVTAIIVLVIDKTIGFRVSEEDELKGVDITDLAESAYEYTDIPVGGAKSAIHVKGNQSDKEEVKA
ncbi:MAG: ammonium transporter [Candidatus Nanopelagicales bacterium]